MCYMRNRRIRIKIFKNKKLRSIIAITSFLLFSVAIIPSITNRESGLNNQVANSDVKQSALQAVHSSNKDLSNIHLVPQKQLNKSTSFNVKVSDIGAVKPSTTNNYVEGEIIVKYKNNKLNLATISGIEKSNNLLSTMSLIKKEDLNKANISVFKINDGSTVEDKVRQLKNDPNIEYAEPNYIRSIENNIGTNDTYGNYQWGLKNVGQTVNFVSGTNRSDIDVSSIWLKGRGAGVIVAVIDTGVAYNHPDLINQMWDGTNCKDYNGNSLGGCNHGYDFENGDKTPLPTSSSHGTHVAGIIAAENNNGVGISGVAPLSKIMALKVDLTIEGLVEAIDFAIQNGAKIINASYGGGSYSQAEYDAINRFKSAGGIFIAAAGNEGSNNDSTPFYPSSYDLDNIISVAATDQNDGLASFSNYGLTSVDVAAPGVNIYSAVADTTVLDDTFGTYANGSIPNGWIKGGLNNNFGVYSYGKGESALYSDPNYPYANNADTSITTPAYDLATNASTLSFFTACNTPYSPTSWQDYMALDYSSDGGSTFTEILRWDEWYTSSLLQYNYISSGAANIKDSIPSQYLTNNFKLRFRWVTDSSDNNYYGCAIDDINITKFSDGSDGKYSFYNGTSMAAPHVAGLAALLEGLNPNMTYIEAKNFILNSGDSKLTLNNYSGHPVASGRRINASKSMNAFLGLTPIYRLYNTKNGAYLYTRGDADRNHVLSTWPEFEFTDGFPAFYASLN